MNATKRTPQLRFPEFTGEWRKKRLGEIGSAAMCKRIFKNQTKPSGDVPFYTIGTFGKNPSAFIDKRLFDEYVGKYLFPKKGDILVSASGTIGRLVVYDGEPAYFQDSNIIWLQHDEGLILNTFLKYVYSRINWIVESSTMPRLYNSNFLAMRVDMPDTKEQQKIATFLAAVDKRVALLERKVQQLEAYKRGVMQQLFSQQLRFTHPDGSHFPAWQEKRLREVFDYQQPTPYLVRSTEYKDTYKTPVLTAGKTFVLGYTNEAEGVYTGLPVTLFDDFTTAVQWVDFPFKVKSSAVKILKTKAEYNPKVAHELLSKVQFKAENHQRHWISIHQNLSVHMPSVAEQQKIAELLSALDEKIALTRQQLDKTKQFKKGLLQRMFV